MERSSRSSTSFSSGHRPLSARSTTSWCAISRRAMRSSPTAGIEVTDELRKLIADMFETMYAAEGIGLAAPQVGRNERVAVVDVEGSKFTLINPRIISTQGIRKEKAEEGCLSIPDIYGDVERQFT